jgi:hypothetical protein
MKEKENKYVIKNKKISYHVSLFSPTKQLTNGDLISCDMLAKKDYVNRAKVDESREEEERRGRIKK